MAWKTFTHDLRAPIQGGDPIWAGTVPYDRPLVDQDTSDRGCGKGWNCCESLSQAFAIAGLWPYGRPSRAFFVEPSADAVVRKNKIRSSGMRILREATEDEVLGAIREMSQGFEEHVEHMTQSQVEWRRALARPASDPAAVESGLRLALEARGLSDWTLKRFDSVNGVWEGRAARVDWGAGGPRATEEAWAAWTAWSAGGSKGARNVWDVWRARDAKAALTLEYAALKGWDAWRARDAKAALTLEYAALKGWTDLDLQALTVGVREAYRNGLGLVYPTGPKELGWAMT